MKTPDDLVKGLDVIQKKIETFDQLESTISQVSQALCNKENATLEEMLEAVSQLKQKVNDMDFACLKLLRKTDKLILDLAEQKGKVEWAHKRMLKLTIERNDLLRQLKEKEAQ